LHLWGDADARAPSIGRRFDARLGQIREPESTAVAHALTGAAWSPWRRGHRGHRAWYLVVGDVAALVGGSGGTSGAQESGVRAASLLPRRRRAPADRAVVGGRSRTLVEAMPWPVDDNWSVPLLGAAALVLLV
jgi:hypothetical protein